MLTSIYHKHGKLKEITHNVGVRLSGAPNVNFQKMSVQKTI